MKSNLNRREAIKLTGCAAISAMVIPELLAFAPNNIMKRRIPSSGEALPLVGLGTWQTFDVGNNTEQYQALLQVLKKMKGLGGTMIDSSPMYGTSEKVVGDLSQRIENNDHFFYATKVWIEGKNAGINQMNASMSKMKRKQLDLMQIHNLVDWETHIKTLRDWKAEGKIRYFGLTHYTDSSHAKLEALIKSVLRQLS